MEDDFEFKKSWRGCWIPIWTLASDMDHHDDRDAAAPLAKRSLVWILAAS